MAASPSLLSALLLNHFLLVVVEGSSSWCVVRTDASYQALKAALDYACWAGADCTPIQSNGLCFLPNTIQAHASYAFNSFYQRKGMSPDSCYFSGTANIARTDPSAMDLASIQDLSVQQAGQFQPQHRQLNPIHSHRQRPPPLLIRPSSPALLHRCLPTPTTPELPSGPWMLQCYCLLPRCSSSCLVSELQTNLLSQGSSYSSKHGKKAATVLSGKKGCGKKQL
ncbi:unnamed protein product [Linum tenue]|uniref:X8 domain-containing protein n=1 Tax=Linum tenue TaxID=586396 RepID=A0AAV0LS30_9ROSI|nr:unnamed protein product [Linum tenue]